MEGNRWETHWFGWDADALALDVIDGKAREFVYRPKSLQPLALLGATAAGSTSPAGPLLYLNDPNGAPTRLIDQTGQVMWSARYAAWGGIAQLYESRVDNPLRLQGQYADQDTRLYFNRCRYFDSHVGGFIGKDPIGLAGGLNVYELGPNIKTWYDPLGLTPTPLDEEGYSVYALYHSGQEKPYYIGLTSQDVDSRMRQHAQINLTHGVARFDPSNDLRKIIQPDLNYAQARGFEQAYIENYGTKTGFPGNVITMNMAHRKRN